MAIGIMTDKEINMKQSDLNKLRGKKICIPPIKEKQKLLEEKCTHYWIEGNNHCIYCGKSLTTIKQEATK